MKTGTNHFQVPYNYQLCLNKECPQANSCLRQLVEQSMPSDIQSWNIISPKYLATLKGTCPHYRSSTKVRLAKGFAKLLDSLPHKQMQAAIAQLLAYFGRRTYYRVRKGERLLSPSEQKVMLNILKNCGISHHKEFDAYLEEYDW